MKYHPHLNIIAALLLWKIFCLPLNLYAQSPEEKINNIYFEKLNFENGLSNNVVKCIFQDHQGYLWFGTADGLNRYDGKNFKVFKNDPFDAHSLCGNIITGIAEDRKGFLWITTQDGGLCCYKQNPVSSMQFEQYKHDPKNSSSVPANNLNAVTIDNDDNIWVASENNGVFKIDSKTKKIRHISNLETDTASKDFAYRCDVLKIDNEGKIWCGNHGSLVFRIDPLNHTVKNYQYFQSANGIKLTAGSIHGLLPDKNILWFPDHFGALNKFNYITNAFEQYLLAPENVSKKRADKWLGIEKDGNGNIWIGSEKNGCYVFNPGTNSFYNFRYDVFNPGSLSDNTVNCLYCDKTGILWIGTDKGVCEYDPLANQVAYHYIRDDKRPDLTNLNIYDFYENDDGSLLLGTDGGLFIRDKNALDFKCKYSGFHNKPLIIYKFFKHSDGKLYLITNSNNFIYDTKRKSLTQIPFFINTPNGFDYSYQNSVKTTVVADTVYNILYSEGKKRSMLISDFRGDKKNLQRDTLGSCSSFWVGSIGWGLYQYHFSQNICGISYHQATPDCLTSNMIQSIIKDNTGKIWIGTNGGGLNAMQFKSFCPGFISFINEPSNPYSLSSNSISDMCSDKNGIFWITTYDGVLNRFNPNAKNKKYFTHITGTGDLSKQSMHSILCDAKNNLWIATASAILKYNTDTNKFFAWKLKEQLPYDQYPGKKYLGKDGTIYFGGNKFYISFHPDSLHINSTIPPVVITSFKIFNQPADDQLLTNEIKLEHNKNFFSFEFASLNFSNPSENKYAHKLDGVDKNWVYTKSKNSAAYTGIGPGKYTFHVKASNNNDVWNEEGISIKVTIIPAWWQTLFFKIAFILAAIALIFFAIRYYFRQKLKAQQLRLEKIKAVENIRSKIAMDIHDEIGSQLTKITLLNQRIKSGFEKKNEIDLSLLNKVTESSKEVISNLGEIIWAVNPKHDNLPSLLAYIRNYISNFCEHTPIHCNIYFPDEIPALAISPDLKHNLFLVIKESLSNILKHAEATEIVIGCHLINKIFCFEITDNGKGMNDLKGREFGNGLLSMRNRMEAINGKFEIKSETNKGTRITLTAELKV